MNETIQDIRSKVQDLLNRAQVDASFRQSMQMNPAAALCTAGVPNAVALVSQDEIADCSWTCLWTCSWTS
ncbi:hypothetical protein [Hyalangium minutum]|uniref:Uncharacterized protein n=1 Tax=Hyalangium minutum TaxID=394096 RepID=A0A085VXG8_9BACT|nr:hypothetical protein [Hyalangium minutum]KFE60131.1 hypothetical protein DB31_6002 [Hyalangium minutum]